MTSRGHSFASLVMVLVLMLALAGVAQSAQPEPDITKVPAAAQPSDHFDVNAATDAYMNLMPAGAKADSRLLKQFPEIKRDLHLDWKARERNPFCPQRGAN